MKLAHLILGIVLASLLGLSAYLYISYSYGNTATSTSKEVVIFDYAQCNCNQTCDTFIEANAQTLVAKYAPPPVKCPAPVSCPPEVTCPTPTPPTPCPSPSPPTTNTTSRKYRFPKDNYVVLAIDDNIAYTFFAPFLAKIWPVMGYKPIFLTYADPAKYPQDSHLRLLFAKTREFGGVVADMPLFNGFVKGVPEMTSRYFLSALDFDPESYIMISDIDMIPLMKRFYEERSSSDDDVTLWNAFAADGAHGSCYIGMTVKLWREIMSLNGEILMNSEKEMYQIVEGRLKKDLSGSNDFNQWIYDQIMFERRLKAWSNNYSNGRVKQVKRAGYARLDRYQGQVYSFNPDVPNSYMESHMVRPGHHASYEQVWDLLTKFGKKVLSDADKADLNAFFEQYKALKELPDEIHKKVWS